MSDFVTNLDQALNRLREGEAAAAILADYPAGQAEFLDELLSTAGSLDPLLPAPLPQSTDLAADRAQFLAELDQLTPPAVSAGPLVRLKGWMTQQPLRSIIQPNLYKEQRRMNTLLVKAMLVLTLVFGGGSGAALASADSLPGEPLYPLKIGLEEARLALTSDPVQQVSQWQERVRERTDEIARLALNGQTIGEAELDRLQTQTQTYLQQTAALPDPALVQQLEQFQQMAQEQQQMLAQADGTQTQAAAQTMTQAQQAAEEGLADPATFRYRYGQHGPNEAPSQPAPTQTPEPTLAPTPLETVSPTLEPTLAPTVTPVRPRHTPYPTGDAYHYGPQPTQPGPGQPGGNSEGLNTPTGDANRYGPQPTQPGPGQPGGNPEGQNTPTGDANHYGPQPTQPGPGQPGGNPEATCTPTGDANRYGAPPATPQPGGNSDNSGGSGGSNDSGSGAGGSDNSGDGSNDSGGSDNSGGSGGSGDSGSGSGGSDNGGSSDSSSGSDNSGSGSNDSGDSGDSRGGGKK